MSNKRRGANSPIYHPQVANVRVAYRCNSQWVVQVKAPPPTDHVELDNYRPKFQDPWEDQHSPVSTREAAIKIMYERFPDRKVANG